MLKLKVTTPTTVVDCEALTIVEVHGVVASSGDGRLSACVVEVFQEAQENFATPEFDTHLIVLEGVCEVIVQAPEPGAPKSISIVREGQGCFIPKGLRCKWKWPGPCKYIPICTPAYTPAASHREEGSVPAAKSPEAMQMLRQLHNELLVADAPTPLEVLPEDKSAEGLAACGDKHREEVRRAVAASVADERRRRSSPVVVDPPPNPPTAAWVLSGKNLVAALALSAIVGAVAGAAVTRKAK